MGNREQIDRFRVAVVTGHLPQDLGAWALSRLVASQPASERRAERDQWIVEAARRSCGSLWARAREVDTIATFFRRRPGLARIAQPEPGSAIEAVLRAWRVDPQLPKFRRLLEILSAGALSGS